MSNITYVAAQFLNINSYRNIARDTGFIVLSFMTLLEKFVKQSNKSLLRTKQKYEKEKRIKPILPKSI